MISSHFGKYKKIIPFKSQDAQTYVITVVIFVESVVHSRDGNRSGRPAGRVAGRVEILRPAGQAG